MLSSNTVARVPTSNQKAESPFLASTRMQQEHGSDHQGDGSDHQGRRYGGPGSHVQERTSHFSVHV